MAVIRFDANVPQEVALKYDGGKEVTSRIPDAPNQMMYSLCGDDTMYVPLHVAGLITQLGIRKLELFHICKRLQGGVTRWEVKRIGDAATTALAIPTAIDDTPFERKLKDSINQARQAVTPAAPASTAISTNGTQSTPNSTPIHHTSYSRMMAAASIAAIDAARETERYAATVGFEIEYTTEDIRMMAATLFIAASKDPNFASQPTQKVNGGTHSWPQ